MSGQAEFVPVARIQHTFFHLSILFLNMAEPRSVPTALGILIGPSIAYVSFLIFSSDLSELLQLLCFAAFFLAGHELSRSLRSLSGVLTVLLFPAIPVAMYLSQSVPAEGNQLGPVMVIALWVISVLVGAVVAAYRPVHAKAQPATRLAVLTIGLLILIIATFLF